MGSFSLYFVHKLIKPNQGTPDILRPPSPHIFVNNCHFPQPLCNKIYALYTDACKFLANKHTHREFENVISTKEQQRVFGIHKSCYQYTSVRKSGPTAGELHKSRWIMSGASTVKKKHLPDSDKCHPYRFCFFCVLYLSPPMANLSSVLLLSISISVRLPQWLMGT